MASHSPQGRGGSCQVGDTSPDRKVGLRSHPGTRGKERIPPLPPQPSQDSGLWYTFLDPWETIGNKLTHKKCTSNQLLMHDSQDECLQAGLSRSGKVEHAQ